MTEAKCLFDAGKSSSDRSIGGFAFVMFHGCRAPLKASDLFSSARRLEWSRPTLLASLINFHDNVKRQTSERQNFFHSAFVSCEKVFIHCGSFRSVFSFCSHPRKHMTRSTMSWARGRALDVRQMPSAWLHGQKKVPNNSSCAVRGERSLFRLHSWEKPAWKSNTMGSSES